MAFNFKDYGGVELEVLGTLASIAGKGGKLRFTNGSVNNTAKQLCVVIKKANGTSDTTTCSKTITKSCRAAFAAGLTKSRVLASLINLDIIEATNGGNYISAPMGEGGEIEEYTIDALKKEEPVTYEELVAF